MPKHAEKTGSKSLSPKEIKDMRMLINAKVEDAKNTAMYTALRKHCNEVDINLTKQFGALPVMTPVSCPCNHGTRCDVCDYLVQYSLKYKKAYCLKLKPNGKRES